MAKTQKFEKTHNLGTDFAEPAQPADRQPLSVSGEVGGSLAVAARPVKAELVDDSEGGSGDRQVFSLIEKASGLVAKFTSAAEDRLAATETAITQLMAGELSIDDLAAQYGELSVAEADAAKVQLSRVMNSLEVQIEKTLVERKGIQLNKEKTFTALAGLKAAFEIKSESERVADARDESFYQADKREQNNVARNQDIDFRMATNALDKQDKDGRISHKQQMNTLGDRFRKAIRTGYEAGVKLKEFDAGRKVSSTTRIMEGIEKAQQKKGGNKK